MRVSDYFNNFQFQARASKRWGLTVWVSALAAAACEGKADMQLCRGRFFLFFVWKQMKQTEIA